VTWTKQTAPSAGTTAYWPLLALCSVADPWTQSSVSAASGWSKATLTAPTAQPFLLLALTSSAEPWTKATTPS
jgi:hypothetical protein